MNKRPADGRPVIGVSGRRRPGRTVTELPSNFGALGIDIHVGAYADAIEAAGGRAVLLPCSDAAPDLLDLLDGLVMTGGSDVDPRCYDEEPHPSVDGVDPTRDRVEIAMVRRALSLGLPLLAVCRGMQVMNVALGGTLVQHLEADTGDHHAAWDRPPDEAAHEVSFEHTSLVASCYRSVSLRVNSLHHQAIGRPGDGVVATAWSDDGTIEAAEVPGRPVLAVQWHPELVAEHPDAAFRWLVEASALARIGAHAR